jgi:hypothetical protein
MSTDVPKNVETFEIGEFVQLCTEEGTIGKIRGRRYYGEQSYGWEYTVGFVDGVAVSGIAGNLLKYVETPIEEFVQGLKCSE